MARKKDLRRQHAGMVLNFTSKKQETTLAKALETVVRRLHESFAVRLEHETRWV